MATAAIFNRWNRDLSRAVGALGSEDFFRDIIAAIARHVQVDYPQVWLYHKELPPQCIYHEIPKKAQHAQIDLYLEGPYREDPFYQVSIAQPRGIFTA